MNLLQNFTNPSGFKPGISDGHHVKEASFVLTSHKGLYNSALKVHMQFWLMVLMQVLLLF